LVGGVLGVGVVLSENVMLVVALVASYKTLSITWMATEAVPLPLYVKLTELGESDTVLL
jgi:hypothetical protein